MYKNYIGYYTLNINSTRLPLKTLHFCLTLIYFLTIREIIKKKLYLCMDVLMISLSPSSVKQHLNDDNNNN